MLQTRIQGKTEETVVYTAVAYSSVPVKIFHVTIIPSAMEVVVFSFKLTLQNVRL